MMTDKLSEPYVRFFMQNGVEVASMLATDFRSAMLERDHEIGRLKAIVDEAMAQNERFDKRYRDAEDGGERLRAALIEIRAMADQQAEDEGLWFIRVTASEAYLQQELRNLHDRIERLTA